MASLDKAISAEVHKAIQGLGGSSQPATPAEAYSALERLHAAPQLLGIVGSWQDTLADAAVLQMLRHWNDELTRY